MTAEQQAAYVIAQAACAAAEIAAMQAEDRAWVQAGQNPYSGEDYRAVIEKYGIHHNAVVSFFHGAT